MGWNTHSAIPNSVNYPLEVISPNSYYRSHSALFTNQLLNGDCYKHRVWMSVYDAVARGISDNDLVRIFSDVGEMYMHAYVTSRMTPGVVAIYHAALYTPNSVQTALMPDGIDVAGNMNFLLKDQQPGTMCSGPVVGSGPVQIELVSSGVTDTTATASSTTSTSSTTYTSSTTTGTVTTASTTGFFSPR